MLALKPSLKSLLALAVFNLMACDEADAGSREFSYRCLTVDETVFPIGLIGLDLVEVSGTPRIQGPSASVFSNKLVVLTGSFDIHGDAIGGGQVVIDGDSKPKGQVIEDAGTINVADPSAEVQAAKSVNDNHTIPCVGKGANCVSPVSGYALSITNEDVTLASGTYYFESISVNGIGQLNTDGEVVIYLNGPATFNGGSATNPDSDSLTVISSASGEIKLNGAAESEMRIYAPFATVRFAGTQGFKGSALGRMLRINGTADLFVVADLATELDVLCEPENEGSSTGEVPPELPEIPM